MKLEFDKDGAARPAGWTDKQVRDSQEKTIRDILQVADQPLTIEQIRAKSGGMAEMYIREAVARLQAKFQVFVLGDRCYLFERDYPL